MNISGPVIGTKDLGHGKTLHVACFYEGDDTLYDLRPAIPHWKVNLPQRPAFRVGDNINTPKGIKTVQFLEFIPAFMVDNELEEMLKVNNIIFTSKLLTGFRYLVK